MFKFNKFLERSLYLLMFDIVLFFFYLGLMFLSVSVSIGSETSCTIRKKY